MTRKPAKTPHTYTHIGHNATLGIRGATLDEAIDELRAAAGHGVNSKIGAGQPVHAGRGGFPHRLQECQ
jgi:hypothetical protein